ncbi:hypothetical protein J3E64_000328 [Sphingobium sp. OAS761]|uniref:hypothetical protein n=1 Tax=Sphingobium sp. OAS761 TaxID=2817901 RepID=UPI00209EC1FF|nr:hypothetical protein [Sphingobium sp. OAS761]MCP1468661.1 hypothetical protein [Sphingobium sp. OAS761]
MSMETDVNYLLCRQQISLFRAQGSASREVRAAYEGMARGYGERIDAYRRENVKLTAHAH